MEHSLPLPTLQPPCLSAVLLLNIIASKLLESGAQVDLLDSGGYQPIHYAACGGYDDIVAKLVSKGARVDAEGGKMGLQPIHCVAHLGRISTLHLLLQLGAKLDAIDLTGRQLVHHALVRSLTFTLTPT